DDDRAGLAEALNQAGEAIRGMGKARETEEAYRRATSIWEALIAKSPETVRYHEELSSVSSHHAEALHLLGRHAEEKDPLRRSVSEGERALELSPGSPSKQWIPHDYRLLGIRFGGPEGEKAFRRAAEIFGELAAERGAPAKNRMYVRHFQADTWKWLGLIL